MRHYMKAKFSLRFLLNKASHLDPSNKALAPGISFCSKSYPGTHIPTKNPTYNKMYTLWFHETV